MLVQALAQYADTYLPDQLGDPAFESKPVPLILEISPDGRFLGWIDREETITRGKRTFRQIPTHEVPRSPVNRNSGFHPLLAFDDAKYVFGPGPKHEAFVKFLQEAAGATYFEKGSKLSGATITLGNLRPGTEPAEKGCA